MRVEITPPPDIDFSSLEADVRRNLYEAMLGGVTIIANDAKQMVASQPKTGRIYTRRGTTHQASAPGEAPATDTGHLISTISGDAEMEGADIKGYVRAEAPYAQHLELGTRNMAARPFLHPAIEANRQRVMDLMRIALASAAGVFARKVGR